MSHTIINSFSLTLEGFVLNFTTGDETTNQTFDPCSACEFFERAGLIEGFDIDLSTGEPVILYEDRMYGRPVEGFSYWHVFVKTFPMHERFAQFLAEYSDNEIKHKRFVAKINQLLAPLKTSA